MGCRNNLNGTPLCHGGMMDMDDAEVRYMHLQCELEQVRKELVEERIIREAVEAEAHMQSLERNAANQRGDELEIERDALAAQVKKLTWNLENAENLFQVARRRAWEFHDRPSTCPYCMAQMPCTKDAVTGHHAVCPRDPMRKVEAELEQARKELVETSNNFDVLSQQYLERAVAAELSLRDARLCSDHRGNIIKCLEALLDRCPDCGGQGWLLVGSYDCPEQDLCLTCDGLGYVNQTMAERDALKDEVERLKGRISEEGHYRP